MDLGYFKSITSRQLNDRERRAVKRIIRFYRTVERYNGVTSIRFSLVEYSGTVWITLKTRRSDCGKNSPRAILCERYLHAKIGPRGAVYVSTATWGIGNDEQRHVQKFI